MNDGIIKTYDVFKGFGFITREKGKDLFFHWTDVQSIHEGAAVYPGMKVSFEIDAGKKHRARNVKIISS